MKLKLRTHFKTRHFLLTDKSCFEEAENRNGRGLILYVKENIPCKLVNSFSFSEKSESLYLKLVSQISNGYFYSYTSHLH